MFRKDDCTLTLTKIFLLLAFTISALGCQSFKKNVTGASDFPEGEESQYINLIDAVPPGYFDIGAGFGVIQKSGNDIKGTLISFKGYPYGRWYSKAKSIDQMTMAALVDKAIEECKKPPVGNDAATAKCETDKQVLSNEVDKLYRQTRDNLIIMTRRGWKHKLSVFYAISADDFEGDNFSTSVDAIGIAIDITPELSFLIGFANFENAAGGISNDYMYGISLNLNAFDILSGK